VHAVLVARRGSLVYEQYLDGTDERWGAPLSRVEHGPEMRHDLRSVTKSVVGLLIGIAIDRGLVAGVDAPVFSFLPRHADLRTQASASEGSGCSWCRRATSWRRSMRASIRARCSAGFPGRYSAAT